jgi:hypothetical protein
MKSKSSIRPCAGPVDFNVDSLRNKMSKNTLNSEHNSSLSSSLAKKCVPPPPSPPPISNKGLTRLDLGNKGLTAAKSGQKQPKSVIFQPKTAKKWPFSAKISHLFRSTFSLFF